MRMICRLWLALVVAVVAGAGAQEATNAGPAEAAKPRPVVKVFIVAGQSNAVGYNDQREYRQGKSTVPDAWRNQPGIRFWNAQKHSWQPLRLGETEGFTAQAFGPEIGFAHNLAKALPNDPIAIIKCAVGSSGIARSKDYDDYIPSLKGYNDHGRHWHPPGDGQAAGELYRQLLEKVSQARSAFERDGVRYELAGVLWMQGEHEAGISPRMAGDYALLLKGLIESLRTDLKTPDLPFAVGEVNGNAWAYGDVVRQAQAEVCRQVRNTALVKTVDLSRQGSGGAAHFDADSMIELGTRFAAAIKPLLEVKAPAKPASIPAGQPAAQIPIPRSQKVTAQILQQSPFPGNAELKKVAAPRRPQGTKGAFTLTFSLQPKPLQPI
jgi:hypothetical protein